MEFTGERMIPEHNFGKQLYADHVDRYAFASDFVRGKRVLDCSCGSGYGSKMMAEAGAEVVIGVDIDPETVKYAEENFSHPSCHFLVGDARHLLPEQHDVFDVIVSFETIEHFTDTKGFMHGVKRLLKKGGLFLLSTPNTDVYPSQSEFHPKMFSEKQLKRLLARYFKHNYYFHQHGERYLVTVSTDDDFFGGTRITPLPSTIISFPIIKPVR